MKEIKNLVLTHAYRHLYRAVLRAVKYSKPARYLARDELRNAFRYEKSSNFDALKIERTIKFLDLAASYRGIEHFLVKNVLHTKFWAKKNAQHKPISKIKDGTKKQQFLNSTIHYDRTLDMLNKTLNICLR
ncbi:BgtA-20996 [Blumeria graminis f. sp. tritici]|uniref:BgtA-20996 n=2 Tax=Blumeria graminis f. sp. tritici TaxID=62690 RepID=A0A9X9L8I5_BLUGR|nr:hypothetical protein BGT96224_A20996 [Blumeria graminis f. sp. tritici 96224]VCU39649.1 BgtA-20996 [Blumeria graminis f. sp. tritici]